MALNPHTSDADTRPAATGLVPLNETVDETIPWMENVEWGPGHMRNDMGPATVIVTDEDIERQATALTVQNAVGRAIGKGEEYEYDE